MSSVDPKRRHLPFGGITVVFGGDFRQILPVIPKATRSEVVNASLNQSYLWSSCKVCLLSKNMRLGTGKSELENKKIDELSKWVLEVGDGNVENIHPEDDFSDPEIVIPKQFLIHNFRSSVKSIVDAIYPDFVKNMSSETYLRQRAILTPTNAIADGINSHVLDLIRGTTYTYLSQDSIDDIYGDADDDYESSFPVEY